MDLIPIPGAEIYYEPRFLAPVDASELFEALLIKCAWKRHKTGFGYPVPRDEAYYGDSGTHYTYSRREYRPLPWIAELLELKVRKVFGKSAQWRDVARSHRPDGP